MEHGASRSVEEQLQTEMIIKNEVEAAATPTVHTDSEMELNSLKPEPVLVHSVKSELALLVKEDILDDGSHDGIDQQCVHDTATPIGTGGMNETCSTGLDDLLNVKNESGDIDIGPIVLQHMDVYYTINKKNVTADTEENSIVVDCYEAMPGGGVKKESAAYKWGGSLIPQEDVTKERSACGTLQNYQLTDVKDHFKSICMVQLVRLDTFQCDLCYIVYTEKLRLLKHFQTVHGLDTVDKKTTAHRYWGQKMPVGDFDEAHIQTSCLGQRKDIQQHLPLQHGATSTNGPKSRELYHKPLLVSVHNKLRQRNKPYDCDNCEVKFTIRKSLNRREGEKSYQCCNCIARFARKRLLNHHMRVHTGKKPYKCENCDARFAQKQGLNQHIRIHTGEKPYQCENCDARFAQKQGLNQHIRVHTGEKPYLCENCDARFAQKQGLNQHIRVHTGEKPYQCEICGARFAQKQRLNQHIRVHTGEKPYQCENCGAQFTQKQYLNQHIRINTGEKPCDN